jgi:hypothetical protein
MALSVGEVTGQRAGRRESLASYATQLTAAD